MYMRERKNEQKRKEYGGGGNEGKEGIDRKLTSTKRWVQERELVKEKRARTGGISEEKS